MTKEDRMHPRQKIALRSPCTTADQTVNPAFRSIQERRGLLLSQILTVNK